MVVDQPIATTPLQQIIAIYSSLARSRVEQGIVGHFRRCASRSVADPAAWFESPGHRILFWSNIGWVSATKEDVQIVAAAIPLPALEEHAQGLLANLFGNTLASLSYDCVWIPDVVFRAARMIAEAVGVARDVPHALEERTVVTRLWPVPVRQWRCRTSAEPLLRSSLLQSLYYSQAASSPTVLGHARGQLGRHIPDQDLPSLTPLTWHECRTFGLVAPDLAMAMCFSHHSSIFAACLWGLNHVAQEAYRQSTQERKPWNGVIPGVTVSTQLVIVQQSQQKAYALTGGWLSVFLESLGGNHARVPIDWLDDHESVLLEAAGGRIAAPPHQNNIRLFMCPPTLQAFGWLRLVAPATFQLAQVAL